LDQLCWVNTQPGCHLEQVVQAQVAPASLDLSEEGPMDPGLMGQGFLAEAQGFATGADAFTEDAGGWGEWFCHSPPNDIRPDCLCTEQLRPMRSSLDMMRPYACARRLTPIARIR
jgi:hypothetical protein